MDYPIHIWSDLHLEHPECDIDGINRARADAEKSGAQIIASGDLVDLWYASRGSIGPESMDVIQWLRPRIMLSVPGNHDSPLVQSPMFNNQRYPYFQLVIDKRIWYIEHGHLLGRWGFVFRRLDRYDDRVWFRKIARAIVKQQWLSRAGRLDPSDELRDAAIDRCKLKGGTVAIVGHNHHPEIYRDLTGQLEVTYVNAGSAIRKMTYATYDGDFKIKEA